MQHVVIIGNGIAGITAARHIRKRSNDRITVISGESDHFFSRTALMYIYMGHMKYEHTKPYEDQFWLKNRIELIRKWVVRIDFDQRKISFDDKEVLPYDKLILATGSKSNMFGWEGEDLKGVQGLYSLQDLELMEANTREISQAVVVGGGLIGVEMAEMLHSRGIDVTFLVREKHFWDIVLPDQDAEMLERHIKVYGIDLRMDTLLKRIIDDGTGKVKAIETDDGEVINCEFVGLAVGVSPNIEFLKGTSLKMDHGILVNENLETNLPNVYAIGDCAQLKSPDEGRRSLEAVWYTGRKMGETVAQTITGSSMSYNPGIWFNSAKFFDIEYQTYGTVQPRPPEGVGQFHWEHGNKGMTFAYDEASLTFLGVNTFGIRLRHEVVDRWLKDKVKLDHVVTHLMAANFDPEFFRQYDPEIQRAFNEEFPHVEVSIRKKSLLEKILG
ncbi:MAG: FAD-dependent oxidoreductase [Cyclobacteriaceae bacterium]